MASPPTPAAALCSLSRRLGGEFKGLHDVFRRSMACWKRSALYADVVRHTIFVRDSELEVCPETSYTPPSCSAGHDYRRAQIDPVDGVICPLRPTSVVCGDAASFYAGHVPATLRRSGPHEGLAQGRWSCKQSASFWCLKHCKSDGLVAFFLWFAVSSRCAPVGTSHPCGNDS